MFYNSIPHCFDNSNDYNEVSVQNGLSFTPAEMAERARRGMPISLDVLSGDATYDSDDSYLVPLEHTRGVDVNQVWEREYESASKIINFRDGVRGRTNPIPSVA